MQKRGYVIYETIFVFIILKLFFIYDKCIKRKHLKYYIPFIYTKLRIIIHT